MEILFCCNICCDLKNSSPVIPTGYNIFMFSPENYLVINTNTLKAHAFCKKNECSGVANYLKTQ